eukprot:68482_1
MQRVQTLINHLNSISNESNDIHFTFPISKEYEYRLVTKNDYADIIELCNDIHGGVDFIPERFHQYLSDNNTIFVGIEYKPKSKIIATRVIKILDGMITAFGFGFRVHSKHRRKKLFVPFSKWHNKLSIKLYPNLKRRRAIIDKHNQVSLYIQQKHFGEIPIPNMYALTCIHIKYGTIKVGEFREQFIKTPQYFEQLLITTNIFSDKYKVDELQLLTNGEYVIDLLMNKFKRKHIIIDTDTIIFDLCISDKSVSDAKSYLNGQIKSCKLNIWSNSKHSALAFICTDSQHKLTEFFIYGLINDELSIFIMINMLFKQWKNAKDKLIDNDCVWHIWIDEEIVQKNVIISKLCAECDSLLVIEKLL